MKTVIIPSESDPFVVRVNNTTYSYPAGTEQIVPDDVAAVIDNYWKLQPTPVKAVDGGVFPYVSDEQDGGILKVINGAWQIGRDEGTDIYCHPIELTEGGCKYTFTIYSTRPSAYTLSSLIEYIKNHGTGDSKGKSLRINGVGLSMNSTPKYVHLVTSLVWAAAYPNKIYLNGAYDDESNFAAYSIDFSGTITDNAYKA